MKVITYNVLDGFENEPKRQDACANWLKEQNPDIVFLNELNDFTQESLQTFANVWGNSYCALLKGRSAYRIAITSKTPFDYINFHYENLLGHGLIIGETMGLTLMTTHLNPHSIKKRHQDLDFILNKISQFQLANKNIIFGGDLNSLFVGEKQYYHDDINLMRLWSIQKNIDKPNIENVINGELDFTLTQRILDAGLIDLLSKFNQKYQRSYLSLLRLKELQTDTSVIKANLKAEKLHARIDYLWTNPTLAETCKSCYIPTDPILENLSDHFPIIANFD